MSISCATAAPTPHPPGEAHAAPRALPPTSRPAQVAAPSFYLGGAAARGLPQGSQPKRPCRLTSTRQTTPQLQPAQQLRPSVAQNASGDTTRQATARLAEGGNQLLDFWTGTRTSGNPKVPAVFPAHFITKHRETKAQTRRDRRDEERLLARFYGAPRRAPQSKNPKPGAPRLAYSRTWAAQPQGGSITNSPNDATLSPLPSRDNTTGEIPTPTRPTTSACCRQKRTMRHATESRPTDSTSCRPVVSPKTRRRHPNPLPCQPLRLLSPETREATTLPARKFAREATTAVIAPLLQWATCRQFGHLFPPFKDYR